MGAPSQDVAGTLREGRICVVMAAANLMFAKRALRGVLLLLF